MIPETAVMATPEAPPLQVPRGLAVVPAGVAVVRAMTVLKAHGVTYGRFPSFAGRAPMLSNAGRMAVGERFSTRSHQVRPALRTDPGASIEIGCRTFINQGAVLHAATSITIGDDVHIGDFCAIYDTNFHALEPGSEVRTSPVVLGDRVWLARGVVVLPGTTIGADTVVGANSVIRGDVPSGVLVAGNPAVVIRRIGSAGGRS